MGFTVVISLQEAARLKIISLVLLQKQTPNECSNTTLPETNSSPLKIGGRLEKEIPIGNHHF